MNNKIIKNALVLFIVTLIAAFATASIYEITKDARAEQEEKTKNDSYKAVMSEADSFEEVSYDSAELEEYIVSCGIESGTFSVDSVAAAEDSGSNIMGYVITVTNNEGYGGEIQFAVGIPNDGTVNGVSILSISETAGLGMKAKEESFLSQFAGKIVEKFTYTKDGATADYEIDAISGATITTNAMTNGVNTAIYSFNYIMTETGGGDTNE